MGIVLAVIFIIRRREELGTRKVLQEAAMLDGLTRIYNCGTVEQMLTDSQLFVMISKMIFTREGI